MVLFFAGEDSKDVFNEWSVGNAAGWAGGAEGGLYAVSDVVNH